MTRIRVTPEELIRAAQQMADIGGRIRQVAGELGSVLNGLDPRAYDGQLYGKVAGRVSSAQGAAQGPASKTSTHAANLNERAQAFTAADQATAAQAANTSTRLQLSIGTKKTLGGWESLKRLLGSMYDFLKLGNLLGTTNYYSASKWSIELVKDTKDLFSTVAPLGLRYETRGGNIIIGGTNLLKELSGLSPQLTRVRYENILVHMAKEASKLKLGSALFDVVPTWLEDISKYYGKDDRKLAGALLVDGWGKTLLYATTALVTAKLTIAAGGLLIAAGISLPAAATVIGGATIAVATGWLMSKAYDRLEKELDERGYKDSAIDAVGTSIFPVIEAVANVLVPAINKTYEAIDRAFAPTIQAIQNALSY
jgi:uncharacterized protein YukE